MSDWQGRLANSHDFPETHLVLGGLALTMRNLPAATRAFQEVTELDPQGIEAWMMLARIAQSTERDDAASGILREVRKRNPGDEMLQDSLFALSQQNWPDARS